MDMKTKICINCKQELPETSQYFQIRKDTGKFRGKCKKCKNAEWSKVNPRVNPQNQKHIYCACGCGQLRPEKDCRGMLRKYINGHQSNGKKCSEKTKKIMKEKRQEFINKMLISGKLYKHSKETIEKLKKAWYEKTEENKKDISQKQRISMIKRIKGRKGSAIPFYNIDSINFFNYLNNKYRLEGLHAENQGEYYIKELGYYPDFYSKKYNLVIEWDEKHHYLLNGQLKPRDKNRELNIKRFLKCEFIRIKQEENNFKKYEELVKLFIINKTIQGEL